MQNNTSNNKENIIKDSLRYAFTTYFAQFAGIIASLIIRKYLGPENMGVWTIILTIFGYTSFSHLGLLAAAEKELPYNYGKKNISLSNRIESAVLSFGTLFTIILVVCILAFVFLRYKEYSLVFSFGLVAVVLFTIVQWFLNYIITVLRSKKEFKLLSSSQNWNTVYGTLITVVLVILFGIYGIYFSMFLSLFIWAAHLLVVYRFNIKYEYDGKLLWKLFIVGLPISLGSLAFIFLLTADRIIIGRMLGLKALGIYSLATMVSSSMWRLPTSFSVILFPRLQEKYGRENDDEKSLIKYIVFPTYVMTYLLPLLFFLVYFWFPVLIEVFLPKYLDGLSAMKIILLGTYFLCLNVTASQYFIVVNRQFVLMLITLLMISLSYTINYYIIRMGWGINGVAVGMDIIYFIYGFGTLLWVLIKIIEPQKICNLLFKILMPIPYYLIGLFLLEYSLPMMGHSLGYNLFVSIIKSVLMGVIAAPIILLIDKDIDVMRPLINMVSRKRYEKKQ
jgi:O-antigen/teichoic acid export membrane protein